jgi:hypothetical protein
MNVSVTPSPSILKKRKPGDAVKSIRHIKICFSINR